MYEDDMQYDEDNIEEEDSSSSSSNQQTSRDTYTEEIHNEGEIELKHFS
jgi:hypothetical protein